MIGIRETIVLIAVFHHIYATYSDKYYFSKTDKGPHIIRHSLFRQTFKIGYPLKLYCEAESPEGPQILWYKNGVELSNDHRKLIRYHFFPKAASSHLQIILTRISDAGLYECIAKDSNGIHMREFHVDYQL